MSNTRGHDCVYVMGHEASAKRILQSKAVHNQFIVNFLQRRMNTSYMKKLYYNYRDGVWVYLRERWEVRIAGGRKFIESTLELVTRTDTPNECVLGRAFPSGVVWLHEYALSNMRRGARCRINAHLDVMYDRHIEDGTSGYFYTRKGTRHAHYTPTPVAHGESFADILEREWSV